MEVFRLLPERTLAEVIGDVIYIFAPPNCFHQLLSGELAAQIYMHVKRLKLGECLTRPIDVFLDEQNAVQPDIFATVAKKFNLTADDK